MSVEGDEDTELRDLVVTTLQSSGVLGKLKVKKLLSFSIQNPFKILVFMSSLFTIVKEFYK